MLIVSENKPVIAPAGTHVARCYAIIDFGSQQTMYGPLRKMQISWELPRELHQFRPERGEEPYSVHKEYSLSLHEKSRLRKDLEGWRGMPFTREDLAGFDLAKLLGAPCMLSVIHTLSRSGGTFALVSALARLPKGETCPPPVNTPIEYVSTTGDSPLYRQLPQWMQDKIARSPEFQAAQSGNFHLDDTGETIT